MGPLVLKWQNKMQKKKPGDAEWLLKNGKSVCISEL